MTAESHLLLTLPRGRRGELRLTRERYEGRPFTRLHIWFPSEPHGELKPSRQSVKIRDDELAEVLRVLGRVQRRIAGGSARQPSAPSESYPNADDLEDLF